MFRKFYFYTIIVYQSHLLFSYSYSDNITLDIGSIDQNSLIYNIEYPIFPSDIIIGSVPISAYNGVPLGSYQRLINSLDLSIVDTTATSIDYIQGDYLYRDLVISYKRPIYSNDIVTLVSHKRKFPGKYDDLINDKRTDLWF